MCTADGSQRESSFLVSLLQRAVALEVVSVNETALEVESNFAKQRDTLQSDWASSLIFWEGMAYSASISV